MAVAAAQPQQDLQIYGADFPEAGGTIRTPAVATPATLSDSHALAAAAPLEGAAADAAVAAPPESEHGPRSPRHAGHPQPQGAHASRPQVSVVYKRLQQKSRDRLEEALIGWAAWHAAAYGDEAEDSHDSLVVSVTPVQQKAKCSGRLRFEPLALSAADGELADPSIAAANAWVDIPEAGEEQQPLVGRASFNLAYEKGGSVPRYDRSVVHPLGLGGSKGTSAQQDAVVPSPAPRPTRAPQRCFNCGSYSHGLRDCWLPRDSAAVTAARADFTAASGGTIAGLKLPSRYFTSMDGAADNSQAVLGDTTAQPTADSEAVPGQLSAELRAALGISESAPPPWLARMRRLGYPPGYMAPDAEPTVDTDTLELVFGDDAPAEMHAAWATAGGTGLTADTTTSGAAAEVAATAAASAATVAGGAQGQAATEAEAALVARLVAALTGARFDSGDVRGVALTGVQQGLQLPDARLETDLVADITSSMPLDKAAQLAAHAIALQAPSEGISGSALTRKQIKRALLMASKRTAAFPGLNAPLPDGADITAWAATEHDAKSRQSHQQRPTLAGSKRAQPEPQSSSAEARAQADGSAPAGTFSSPQSQRQKLQRRDSGGNSLAVNSGATAKLMNGQHGLLQPLRQVPTWPGFQQQSPWPQPAPMPNVSPPRPPPRPPLPQQQQQQQQGARTSTSWDQQAPPPPPPSPPAAAVLPQSSLVPQQPQPTYSPYVELLVQQPSWPQAQPAGGHPAQQYAPAPQAMPQPLQFARPTMQQQGPQQQVEQQHPEQHHALQTLPDWQPPQQQSAAVHSGAWQQACLTPAAQQVWSSAPQQSPQSHRWRQHSLPQTHGAIAAGWQQQQQQQQQQHNQHHMPHGVSRPPPLPQPTSSRWDGQHQPPLPSLEVPQQLQHQLDEAHRQPQPSPQQPHWQQAAWQQHDASLTATQPGFHAPQG